MGGLQQKLEGHNRHAEESPWIICAKNFATFLRNVKEGETATVKIAILDDGIDVSIDVFRDKIATGRSFYPGPNRTGSMNAYYVPTGKHGTRAATLISEICPNPQLYVARLDEKLDGDGRRQIAAESAAKVRGFLSQAALSEVNSEHAILWAVDCKVDIISMSWSIEAQTQESEDLKKLQAAISVAENAEILMFCSASDRGSHSEDRCYPGDLEKCITIGGASSTGESLSWVHLDNIDFLFPGEKIPFMNNDGTLSYESGNSVATAAASGLAGLLLFCSRLLDEEDEAYFKVRDNMKRAFKTMSIGTDRQFPRVDHFFEHHFKSLLLADEPEQTKSGNLSSVVILKEEWNDRSGNALSALIKLIKWKSSYS
ncbi:hypothetical protein DL771_004405 [Monosporascus sp. 5C6A]|nr:hypothetical protein DL771_004405 [Monosporascus sp. 5C6A]